MVNVIKSYGFVQSSRRLIGEKLRILSPACPGASAAEGNDRVKPREYMTKSLWQRVTPGASTDALSMALSDARHVCSHGGRLPEAAKWVRGCG
jgi:hypothetical protein